MLNRFESRSSPRGGESTERLSKHPSAASSANCNLAGCHSCAFLPETSCKEQNLSLDRALLVGTQGNPEMGFLPAYCASGCTDSRDQAQQAGHLVG